MGVASNAGLRLFGGAGLCPFLSRFRPGSVVVRSGLGGIKKKEENVWSG